MYVFAFDRDHSVDVSPHPERPVVPLRWVTYLTRETDHEVWAIGNQDLKAEADIPGIQELVRRLDNEWYDKLGDRADEECVDGWTHYFAWDFVEAVKSGSIDVEFPDDRDVG